MKKRLLIMISILALLVCGIALAVAAEDDTTLCKTCQHCNEEVDWVPVVFGGHYVQTNETETTKATSETEASGETENPEEDGVYGTAHEEGQTHLHYYLDKDYNATEVEQIVIFSGIELCLDLNGHTITSLGRLILGKEGGVTVSVMDSSTEGTGAVNAYSTAGSNNVGGGVMWIKNNGELNIYGGTYSLENALEDDGTWRTDSGGIIFIDEYAQCNISDANIIGTDVGGSGGAIYVHPNGKLVLSGDAVVTAGSAEERGSCVYCPGFASRVALSGNANVDEIYYDFLDTQDPNLVVSGVYTGSANLRYDETYITARDDLQVATNDNADISDAILHCTNEPGFYVVEQNDYLVLSSIAANVVNKYCQHCGVEVEWVPAIMGEHLVGDESDTASKFYHDPDVHLHYYLHRDTYSENMVKQFNINSGVTLCLDLNGKTINAPGRMFLADSGAEINIVDSVGGGTVNVTSQPKGNNIYGGVMYVLEEGKLNVYGGTYNLTNDSTLYTTNGGILYIDPTGVCNLHGGTFNGAEVKNYGGAVQVASNGTLNIDGNTVITAGAASKGSCVYLAGSKSRVTLSGNSCVDELYIAYNINNSYCLTVSGEYTGTAEMYFDPANVRLSEGVTKVGVSDNADIHDNLRCTNDNGYYVTVDGEYLVITLFEPGSVAGVITDSGEKTGYPSLAKAVESYTGDGYITMLEATDESVTLDKNVVLALNGLNINGTITVNKDYTLYGMDSKTDDYTVSDDDYGRIKEVTGAGEVKGYPETTGGYLMISEDDGVSFHKVNLKLTEMVLRPITNGVCAPSVYYKSDFMADEKVASRITRYGIALSVTAEPDASNIEDPKICHCSWFTEFAPGADGNSANGTLLKEVMKPTNANLVNWRNANRGVFGRAYIEIGEGEYMFGDAHERTLRDQAEAIDAQWNDLTQAQKDGMKQMYDTYSSIVAKWDMPNLIEDIGPILDKDETA